MYCSLPFKYFKRNTIYLQYCCSWNILWLCIILPTMISLIYADFFPFIRTVFSLMLFPAVLLFMLPSSRCLMQFTLLHLSRTSSFTDLFISLKAGKYSILAEYCLNLQVPFLTYSHPSSFSCWQRIFIKF